MLYIVLKTTSRVSIGRCTVYMFMCVQHSESIHSGDLLSGYCVHCKYTLQVCKNTSRKGTGMECKRHMCIHVCGVLYIHMYITHVYMYMYVQTCKMYTYIVMCYIQFGENSSLNAWAGKRRGPTLRYSNT